MPKITVALNISPQELLRYYKGNVQSIVAHAEDGRVIRFPVNTVRQLVSAEGVKGRFEIEFNQDGKFMNIRPCS